MSVSTYPIHELAEVFPPMDDEHFADLKASIAAHGQRHPITVWDGKIIDGKHRYQACQELDIEPRVKTLDEGEDPLVYIVEENALRRQMTTGQRAITAARICIASEEGRPRKGADGAVYTANKAAAAFGVSLRTVQDGRRVVEYGDQDLIHRCCLPPSAPSRERLSVSNAAELIASHQEALEAAEKARREERELADARFREAQERAEQRARQQVDEAVEAERRRAAEEARIELLESRGLTEEYQQALARFQEQEREQEQRRQEADAERDQARRDQQELEAHRQQLESERQELQARAEAAELALELERERSSVQPPPDHANQEAVAAARRFLDGFDLDPLSSEARNAAVQAADFITDAEASLNQTWSAPRVWLELPADASLCVRFTAKLLDECQANRVGQALVLALAATGAPWFQDLAAACSACCLLRSDHPYVHHAVFLMGDNAGSDLDTFANSFAQLGSVIQPYYEPDP